ncbi:ENY2 [Symbiodinium sp. CCMP2592]|nr:ENY2 [Symbiodinium sp. CCMP2592]
MADASAARRVMEQNMLDMKLEETGEREQLKQYIISHLNECGWREELKKQCVEFIQNKGVEKVTLEDMINDIAPKGRASLPEKLKVEVFNRLRTFAEKQGMQH